MSGMTGDYGHRPGAVQARTAAAFSTCAHRPCSMGAGLCREVPFVMIKYLVVLSLLAGCACPDWPNCPSGPTGPKTGCPPGQTKYWVWAVTATCAASELPFCASSPTDAQ